VTFRWGTKKVRTANAGSVNKEGRLLGTAADRDALDDGGSMID
jgi:hypothetical protein